jgi:hypothetical protein
MKHLGVVVAGGVALAVLAFAPVDGRAQTTREVSRSTPIIADVGGVEAQYQGTFEITTPAPPVTTFNGAADAATFEFPYTLGHLRAVRITDLPAVETAFADLIDTFDTGDPTAALIPTPNPAGCGVLAFTSACRTVFTTVAAPDAAGLAQRPTRIPFDTANLAALKPLLAPALSDFDVQTLIGLVLAGVPDGSGGRRVGLGGIDRSTLAIIEASPFIAQIAGEDRPTMIYVGALDGMLHAICAEVRGPCLQEGQELWAFIPRTQLGQLRFNTQRVDGTVRVADVFDDFNLTDGVLQREFRTVLTFQTGSGDPLANNLEPSVLALDVSNPADPTVLWERTTPSIAAPVMQGVGLNLAMGQVRVGGVVRNFTFAQSNNGANATDSGFYLAAIDSSTGVEEWSFQHLYPDPRTVGNPAVPDSGIPGGAAAFDLDQSGLITHVAVTSLYGDLWVFPAAVAPPVTSEPIFRFSQDFQPIGAPPTIYFDQSTGRLHAVVVSGSYADPVAATWVQPADEHFVVSVAVDPPPASLPIDEIGTSFGEERAFVITLAPGQRVSAQAVVAGNELFVTSDSTDTNLATFGEATTGQLTRISLATGAVKGTAVTIPGGASSVDVSAAGQLGVASGAGAMGANVGALGGGGAFDGTGTVIERSGEQNSRRLLWMNG